MRATVRRGVGRWQGLATALLLGLALALLSYVRRIGDMHSAIFSNGVVDALLAGQFWGAALAHNVLRFAAVLLLLHLLFGLVCWLLARLGEIAWPRLDAQRTHWVWMWALALAFTLLMRNAAYFPGSSLGEPYATVADVRCFGVSVTQLLSAAVALAIAATVLAAAWRARRALAQPLVLEAGAAAVALALIIAACSAAAVAPGARRAANARPNVIIIGIDSLRNDLLPPGQRSVPAPHVARFLQQATRFEDAITPLARTFPSWLAILTGEHPHTTGGALNLLPRDMVHDADALGFVLRRAGYRTAYGIDEVRFSNIDASYGFDQIITPPIGASEFLIGWFGDTPLSNALVNTSVGKWLFPHLHANRGAEITFDPHAYVRRVADELQTDGRPLFLALHLTLAHWPYVWKDSAESERTDDASSYDLYLRAVRRVDAQFAALLAMLRGRGLLDNAIVIVLSDHGESFVPGRDSVGPADGSALQALDAVPGWGHGTSVLAPDQFRVVLGIQLPGAAGQAAAGRVSEAPVSVEDINPTICELLGLAPSRRADGRSLVALLRGASPQAAGFSGRIRFTESEFTPKGVVDAANHLSTSGVAFASRYYKIDPVTDRLTVRRKLVEALLTHRQFAAMTDHELLAAIPDPERDGFGYLLVHEPFRQGGRVERLAASPPEARGHAEALRLWQALQARFGRTLRPQRTAAQPLLNAAAPNHS
jgi:arylsulfatase A-like enzyme